MTTVTVAEKITAERAKKDWKLVKHIAYEWVYSGGTSEDFCALRDNIRKAIFELEDCGSL